MSTPVNKRIITDEQLLGDTRELALYTLRITSNEKVFRPDLQEPRMKKIEEMLSEDKKHFTVDELAEIIKYLQKDISKAENIYISMIDNLRNSANAIHMNLGSVDNIPMITPNAQQLKEESLLKAMQSCWELKGYISMAHRLCHLRTRRVIYGNDGVDDILERIAAVYSSNYLQNKKS